MRSQNWVIGLALMFSYVIAVLADTPTIVAASDLKFAVEEIAASFKADTKHEVKLVFGSSGNFYRQIEQGAPFQMFLSADEGFVFKLANSGKTVDLGELYAVGHIGIIVPKGSPLKADAELKDLAAALADGRLRKFAIANPEQRHALRRNDPQARLRRVGH